jgi:hypothetical protein
MKEKNTASIQPVVPPVQVTPTVVAKPLPPPVPGKFIPETDWAVPDWKKPEVTTPLFPDQKQKQETMEEKAKRLIDEKAKAATTPVQTDKDKAWSAVRGSYTDQYKFLTDNPDYAKALGIDMSMQPKDLEATLRQIGDRNASDMAYLKSQNALASQIDVSGNQRAQQQTTAAQASMAAQFTQGQEGAIGSSNAMVSPSYDATTNQIMRENDLRLQSAQAARDQAVINLQNAQQGASAKTMQALQDQVNNAEAKILEARHQALVDANIAAKTAADIAQTKAGTQKVQTETLVNTFTAMGEKVSNLNATDLTAMASASGLPYSTVSNLQAQAVLTNQIAKTKDVNEAAKMTLELDKLKKENAIVGKPSAVQEYEYMKTLSSDDQAKYLLLKNEGYSFSNITNANGSKSVVATNPGTGSSHIAMTIASNSAPIESGTKMSDLSDDQLSALAQAMAKREGYGQPGVIPTTHNNPGDIKIPAGGMAVARQRYNDPGAQPGKMGKDGGQFIVFSSPEKGFEAVKTLLKNPLYANLSVDAAMRKWSGGGYGGEVASGIGEKTPAKEKTTTQNVSHVNNAQAGAFDAVKNEYGHVTPEVYNQAKKEAASHGYAAAKFDAAFGAYRSPNETTYNVESTKSARKS